MKPTAGEILRYGVSPILCGLVFLGAVSASVLLVMSLIFEGVP